MSDDTLYIKVKGRYQAWGKVYDAFPNALPYGIWWVRKNAVTNVQDRLISEEELKVPPVVGRRIAVKEKILEYIHEVTRNEESKSWDDVANDLAKILVPSQRKHHKIKGVRLRNGNRRGNSRRT
jgi:hypothetical protein